MEKQNRKWIINFILIRGALWMIWPVAGNSIKHFHFRDFAVREGLPDLRSPPWAPQIEQRCTRLHTVSVKTALGVYST